MDPPRRQRRPQYFPPRPLRRTTLTRPRKGKRSEFSASGSEPTLGDVGGKQSRQSTPRHSVRGLNEPDTRQYHQYGPYCRVCLWTGGRRSTTLSLKPVSFSHYAPRSALRSTGFPERYQCTLVNTCVHNGLAHNMISRILQFF